MAGPPVAAIPWRFQDSPITKLWQWVTTHFQVTVTTEHTAFGWEVTAQGGVVLAVGRVGSFADAEAQIREVIGKSYPPSLGYGRYAGVLATTFTLAGGQRCDLGEFNGQMVLVAVRTSGRGEQVIRGRARVVHYELHVDGVNGTNVVIQPAHIARIVREAGGGVRAASAQVGVGRLYQGGIAGGCTGRSGFLPGTVDHIGPPCPVHESTGGGLASLPILPTQGLDVT